MPKIMDPILPKPMTQHPKNREYSPKIVGPLLPILSLRGYWAIIFGTLGGPGPLHSRLPQSATLGQSGNLAAQT